MDVLAIMWGWIGGGGAGQGAFTGTVVIGSVTLRAAGAVDVAMEA